MRKRKLIFAVFLMGMSIFLTSCATTYPTSGIGYGIFIDVTEPVDVGSGKIDGNLRVGTAQCSNILGLIVNGDCSIDAAVRSAGIKEIAYIDKEVVNVLGIFGKVTIKVYGK